MTEPVTDAMVAAAKDAWNAAVQARLSPWRPALEAAIAAMQQAAAPAAPPASGGAKIIEGLNDIIAGRYTEVVVEVTPVRSSDFPTAYRSVPTITTASTVTLRAAPPAEAPLPVTFDTLAPRQKVIAEALFCTTSGGADDTLMDMAASIACAQAIAVEHALIDEGMLGGYPLPEHAPAVDLGAGLREAANAIWIEAALTNDAEHIGRARISIRVSSIRALREAALAAERWITKDER